MDVTVGLGGGSGEVYVSWDPAPELDVHHYNAYYSEFPGGTYVLEETVDESVRNGSNRVFFVDWPRSLIDGRDCYVISAVDLSGNEGPTSVEACFDHTA